eukprot:GHUV01023824.1.p1 GENE.GHUV01023824.1~~GHUV01023824.1.p1  ORF type:complete len:146 (-),score=13.33 GHUV01023824.1:416-853(-)
MALAEFPCYRVHERDAEKLRRVLEYALEVFERGIALYDIANRLVVELVEVHCAKYPIRVVQQVLLSSGTSGESLDLGGGYGRHIVQQYSADDIIDVCLIVWAVHELNTLPPRNVQVCLTTGYPGYLCCHCCCCCNEAFLQLIVGI